MPPAAPPLPDTYWAGPRLLAGPAPGHAERAVQKVRLRALLDAGIRCVVDLTTPGEIPSYRVALDRLVPAGEEAVYLQVPISDGTAPGSHAMRAILDIVDASIRAERSVYVHCLGGLGRTGTVVACWLIRHGLADAAGVYQRVAELRRGQPNGSRPSPETSSQRGLVATWAEGL